MNIKRVFGTVLTILGIIGLIYTGYSIIKSSASVKELLVIGIIGLIFFISGMGLVRNTSDQAK